MTIIFPCDCGSCYECRVREWFRIQTHPVYKENHPRREQLILSRGQAEIMERWAQEHPKTAEEAFAHNSPPLSVTNESHDQKKSRLKREHDTRMREAFLYGRQR